MTVLVLFLAFIAKHAAALTILIFVAAMAGTFLAGREESFALRLALGLAAIGQIFVLLGIAGLLRPWAIVTIAIALTIGGVARGRISPRTIQWPWLAAICSAIGAAIMPFLLLALFPPIAFDETLYHLPFVQHLARSGAIEFLGNLRFPAFPQLHELLTGPLFLTLGDTATHLVTLAELIALAGVMIASCHGEGSNGERRTAGILAASLCLGHPIVVQFGTVNYVEIALVLFVTAGFVCLDRVKHPSRNAAMAGFFLGTACSVKHLGLYFAAAGLGYQLLFGTARRRTVPIFLCALALATLPMYGEIAYLTGNPVHPFAPSLFGATPWTLPDAYSVPPATRISGGLRLLWNITFAREQINMQPPYSPLFAIAFALTLVASVRHRRAAFIAAVVVGYIAIFTFLPQDSRYLLPLIPLVSVVAARIIASWLETRPRGATIAMALSLLFISPAFAYAGYRLARQGLPPVTAAQRHSYLERRIPAYRALQKRGPGPTYVCAAEELQSFANGLIGDFNGRTPIQIVIGESRDAATLAQALQRIGARELLVSRTRCPASWQSLPREPHFRLIYEDAGATLWRLTSFPPPRTRDSAR